MQHQEQEEAHSEDYSAEPVKPVLDNQENPVFIDLSEVDKVQDETTSPAGISDKAFFEEESSLVSAADTTDGGSYSGNAIDQETFLRILADHHRWVESQGKEGRRANLRGQELTHLDLSNLNLMECSFRGANLTGVSLAYSDMRTADFSEAILMQANLTGAHLTGANLVRANLQYSQNSQADFTGANMTALRGDHASFQHVKMMHTILREASLLKADFSHATITETNLRNSNLSDAIFTDANLTGSDFRDTNCERAHFKGANLSGTNFKAANLSSVEMDKTDFSLAQDVSKTYQTESLNLEKTKLAEEQEAVKRAQSDLAAREKLLAEGKNQLEHERLELSEKMEQIGLLAMMASKPSRWFTFAMLVFLVLMLGYSGLIYLLLDGLNFSKIKNMMEFLIATGIMLLLFMTFFISFLKALQIKRIVKRLLAAGLADGATEPSEPKGKSKKLSKPEKDPKVFQSVSTVSRGSVQTASTMKQKKVAAAVDAASNAKSSQTGGFGKRK